MTCLQGECSNIHSKEEEQEEEDEEVEEEEEEEEGGGGGRRGRRNRKRRRSRRRGSRRRRRRRRRRKYNVVRVFVLNKPPASRSLYPAHLVKPSMASSVGQGLTLVHFPAHRKRFVCDRGMS